MPSLARTCPTVALGIKYAEQVAAGKLLACAYVRQACERQLADLDTYRPKDSLFYWDAKSAERVCSVVQHFPHIKGVWASARKHLELQGWQAFIVSTVFGWMCTATDTRRFRIAYIEVPRKNAKSTLTSALGNYLMACDDEAGALVVSAANASHQAKLVFNDAQLMARKEPGFLQTFGVEVLAHAIVQQRTASKFEAVSAEYSNLDGLNIHAALVDELHAHPTRGLWDVLITATGSRSQSIIWAITTAGVNRAGVCYDQRSHVIDILERRVQDESYFGIVYTKDHEDDPWDEATWKKANPNYGISIFPEPFHADAKRAMVMPAEQNNFLTKHLDVWVNADSAWLPAGAWDRCEDRSLDLNDFLGQPCDIGVDLARRSDITALMLAFPPASNRDYWAVFGRYYLPEQTVNRYENAHYQAWETENRLTATPGVITDFEYIIENLYDLTTQFWVQEIAFDPADAGPVVALIQRRGVTPPMVEIKQSATNMSPAMVEMEGLVLSGRIHHDGDPVLGWMMTNVKARRAGDLIYPTKDAEDKKIDGVTALLMCILRAMKNGLAQAEWETRGLWSV